MDKKRKVYKVSAEKNEVSAMDYTIWRQGVIKGFPWTALSSDPGTGTTPGGGYRKRLYFRRLKDAKAYFKGDIDVEVRSDWN